MDRRGFMRMCGMVVLGMGVNGIAEYRPKFFVHGEEWIPPVSPKASDSIQGMRGDERWIVWGGDDRSVLFHKKDNERVYYYTPCADDGKVAIEQGKLVLA